MKEHPPGSMAAEFMQRALAGGGFMSGPPVEADFMSGWAKRLFGSMRAHFYRVDRVGLKDRGMVEATSLCGDAVAASVDQPLPLLYRGNWPQCQRCMRRFRNLQL